MYSVAWMAATPSQAQPSHLFPLQSIDVFIHISSPPHLEDMKGSAISRIHAGKRQLWCVAWAAAWADARRAAGRSHAYIMTIT